MCIILSTWVNTRLTSIAVLFIDYKAEMLCLHSIDSMTVHGDCFHSQCHLINFTMVVFLAICFKTYKNKKVHFGVATCYLPYCHALAGNTCRME